MWQCPVCTTNNDNHHSLCTKCGFDERTDFVAFRTLCPVSAMDYQTRMQPQYKMILTKLYEIEGRMKRQEQRTESLLNRLSLLEEQEPDPVPSIPVPRENKVTSMDDVILEQVRKTAKKEHAALMKGLEEIAVKSCPGTFVIVADGIYDGEIKDGQRCGYGMMTLTDNSSYDGMWMDDQKEGYGCERDGNGAKIYEGKFHANERSGYGILYFNDGSWYEGYFKNGKRNGYGMIVHSDHSVAEGYFKNDFMDGYGVTVSSKGDVYKGHFEHGFRKGRVGPAN